MPIKRVGLLHWRTAIENMVATITFPDSVMTIPCSIPSTEVIVHLLSFPTVAMVDACVGAGLDLAGNKLVVVLPPEPVMVDLTTGKLIAKEMKGCPTTLTLADGSMWLGMTDFPDCITDIFNGGASAITATGTLTKR